jgi:hypothetical protein
MDIQNNNITPPVLPLNLTFWDFFCYCPERTCPIHTSNFPNTKSHIHFLSLKSFIQEIRPGPRLLVVFRNKLIFYGKELLAPRLTPKLEDHPLSAVRDCLFSILAATLQNWRESPPSATWGRTMPWWQGTHLTWRNSAYVTYFGVEEMYYLRPRRIVLNSVQFGVIIVPHFIAFRYF